MRAVGPTLPRTAGKLIAVRSVPKVSSGSGPLDATRSCSSVGRGA